MTITHLPSDTLQLKQTNTHTHNACVSSVLVQLPTSTLPNLNRASSKIACYLFSTSVCFFFAKFFFQLQHFFFFISWIHKIFLGCIKTQHSNNELYRKDCKNLGEKKNWQIKIHTTMLILHTQIHMHAQKNGGKKLTENSVKEST